MIDKLVNPVDYQRDTNPEAYEFLVGSGMDLRVEVDLMIARAHSQNRRYVSSDDLEKVLVPDDICEEVMESSMSEEDMKFETGSIFLIGPVV